MPTAVTPWRARDKVRIAKTAKVKITGDATRVPDQLAFLGADPGNDAMKASVMARTRRTAGFDPQRTSGVEEPQAKCEVCMLKTVAHPRS